MRQLWNWLIDISANDLASIGGWAVLLTLALACITAALMGGALVGAQASTTP